ncbi:hypothetical protein Hanom_Chr17g01557031 [Helianthus anomalus]
MFQRGDGTGINGLTAGGLLCLIPRSGVLWLRSFKSEMKIQTLWNLQYVKNDN